MSGGYVTIERYDNILHAEIAQIRLEEAGIPVYLHNRNIVWVDPFLSNAVGNIKVQVPAEYEQEARELIESIREKIRLTLDNHEPLQDEGCLNCGEPMPEDVDTCAKCGWSYADTDEPDPGASDPGEEAAE